MQDLLQRVAGRSIDGVSRAHGKARCQHHQQLVDGHHVEVLKLCLPIADEDRHRLGI